MPEELVGAAAITGRYVLAFVLLTAATPKLFARGEFESAVSNYGLLPRRFVGSVATWLPRLELACALSLFLGLAVVPVAALAGLLLLVFSVAVAVNLRRGRRISCGCFSTVAPRTIGWSLVVGDLALTGVAVLVALADPGVLAFGGPAAPGASTLSPSDGLAGLLLAAVLVLGFLLVAASVSLRSATQALRAREEHAA